MLALLWAEIGLLWLPAVRCSALARADIPPLQVLSATEYSTFCLATEGVECDEERWDAHCKRMGADPAVGLECSHFSKLYKDKQFARHFGKLALDMPRVSGLLARRALLTAAHRPLGADCAACSVLGASGCVFCSGGLGATAGAPAREFRAADWVCVAV